MAVGQNLRYRFGDDYHPTIVFFKGLLGVHPGTGVLTHSHISSLSSWTALYRQLNGIERVIEIQEKQQQATTPRK